MLFSANYPSRRPEPFDGPICLSANGTSHKLKERISPIRVCRISGPSDKKEVFEMRTVVSHALRS
jgi:hypothetical protein